jgi:eukaryotic-like serine/threonine-protein kinase
LFEVLTGKVRAQTSESPIEINNAVPQKLNEITLGLLEENPSNRISSTEKLKSELASI